MFSQSVRKCKWLFAAVTAVVCSSAELLIDGWIRLIEPEEEDFIPLLDTRYDYNDERRASNDVAQARNVQTVEPFTALDNMWLYGCDNTWAAELHLRYLEGHKICKEVRAADPDCFRFTPVLDSIVEGDEAKVSCVGEMVDTEGVTAGNRRFIPELSDSIITEVSYIDLCHRCNSSCSDSTSELDQIVSLTASMHSGKVVQSKAAAGKGEVVLENEVHGIMASRCCLLVVEDLPDGLCREVVFEIAVQL